MDTARYRARRHESSQTDADAAMAFISNRPGPRQFQGTKNELKRMRWSRVTAERGTTNAGNGNSQKAPDAALA